MLKPINALTPSWQEFQNSTVVKNRLSHLQLHKQPFPLCHYCEISNFPNVAAASQIMQTHTAHIRHKKLLQSVHWELLHHPLHCLGHWSNTSNFSDATINCEVAMTVCRWLSMHQHNIHSHRIFKLMHLRTNISQCLGIVLKNNDTLRE